MDLSFHDASGILDSLPLGVFSVDPDGVVLGWSWGAERVLGYARPDVVGAAIATVDASGDRGLADLVARALSAGSEQTLFEGPCRVCHADGRGLYLHVGVQVIRDEGGQLQGAIGSLVDLTSHRQLGRRAVGRPLLVEARPERPMVGQGASMQEVLRRLELAAKSDVTVLLSGESGTGKELAAGAIHRLSKRRERPFLSVNCSAIPEPLLESELFGHVRGAFTGAARDKVGLFVAAEGGTLFLDEVGDLSKSMQVKLLRALQEREVRRVGDEKTVRFDARIISATNRDLPAMIEAGDYREDFYYRIRVFEVTLPPLRDRLEDVPGLVEHFVRTFGELHHKPVRGLTVDALAAVLAYRWPGNIRQLQNAIEHAFVTVSGEEISVSDLPPEVLQQAHAPQTLGTAPVARGPKPVLDRERVAAALRESGGRRAQAARALGVSRVTLWKKIRQFSLEEEGRDGA